MNGPVRSLSPDKYWNLAVIQLLSSINKEMAERKRREPISKEGIYKELDKKKFGTNTEAFESYNKVNEALDKLEDKKVIGCIRDKDRVIGYYLLMGGSELKKRYPEIYDDRYIIDIGK